MNSSLDDSGTAPLSPFNVIDTTPAHHRKQSPFSQGSRPNELALGRFADESDGLGLKTGFLKLEVPMDSTAADSNLLFNDFKSDASLPDLLLFDIKTLENDNGLWSSTSTELMHMLLGSQTDDIPDFSLTLNDDRFRLPNLESAVTLYPV